MRTRTPRATKNKKGHIFVKDPRKGVSKFGDCMSKEELVKHRLFSLFVIQSGRESVFVAVGETSERDHIRPQNYKRKLGGSVER